MESNWSLLNPDLLTLVVEKLPLHLDFLHFSVVCKSWHDVSKRQIDQRINSRARNIPLLLVPIRDGSEKDRGLYNVASNKNLNFQVSLPYHLRCAGSSHGWLFFNTETCFIMLNPSITGGPITLPPVNPNYDVPAHREESYYASFVDKAVLSCDPSLYPNNYEVLVIYGCKHKLAIFKAGDKYWTRIEDYPYFHSFDDAIYCKGAFYVINSFMVVCKIMVTTRLRRKKEFIEKITTSGNTETVEKTVFVRSYKISMVVSINYLTSGFKYLVELSNGDLVCVVRIFRKDTCDWVTSSFRVFKLVNRDENKTDSKTWIEIKTIGRDALFLGDNHSIAIDVSEIGGYKENSIYYIDDQGLLPSQRACRAYHVGVFHLENRSFGRHFKLDSSHRHMPSAIWVVPSLSRI